MVSFARTHCARAIFCCGAIAVLALFGLTASPVAAGASTDGVSPSGSKPALCAASAVHVAITTNRTAYAAGQLVRMKSSITNVSKTPCSVWLGLDPGFSPSFLVTNAKKKEVWDRCWVDDRSFGCSEVLYQDRLGPGQSYHTIAEWDQGSGTQPHPPERVHPGTYTVVTYYQDIARTAKVRFKISR